MVLYIPITYYDAKNDNENRKTGMDGKACIENLVKKTVFLFAQLESDKPICCGHHGTIDNIKKRHDATNYVIQTIIGCS